MLSENAFEQLPAKIEQRLTAINTEYLEMIGRRIKEIGTVSATDIHRLNQMREFGSDVDVIIKKLADAADKNVSEINRIFEYVAKDGYTDAEIFYKAIKTPYIPYAKNTVLRDYVSAIAKQTANSYKNLSNTTAIGFRVKNLQGETVYKGLAETYKEVIDKAIYEASIGLTDYNSAMRSTLKELADSGIRVVDYESGYSRRMDSAVRQNILDGIREVNQGVQQRIGKEIKSDGVEISAHFNPAPDHAPYQGRQYTHEEFQQLNDSLARRIGTWNCMHYTHEIILGVSQPAYSNKELQDILEKSKVKKMFDGKEYTPYEATQLQRKIETAVRAAKDRAVIAKASGDDLLRRQEQARITQLKHKYKELSDTFDLPVRTERMVVSGFRPVKAIDISKAIDNMYSRFGIANVDMSGLSSYVSKKVEKAIADIMTDYPQLVGFIQSLEVDTSRPSVASATINLLNGEIKTSLRINPNLLKDIKSVDKAINDEVSVGFWTKKDGIKGIIEHEMGHMLEYSRAFVEAGVNPFSVNPNDLTLKIRALDTIGKRDISRRTIIQAFANLGLPVNIPTITSELSEYASYNFSEAFAEAISDANKKRVSREVIKIIKGWK